MNNVDPDLINLLKSLKGETIDFFPNLGNAGDGFIAYATYQVFRSCGISPKSHRHSDDVQSKLLVMGGGGNLVDGKYYDMAKLISRFHHFSDIILLPQTISGYYDLLLSSGKINIFCRERSSYDEMMRRGGIEEKVLLSHDMTLFLDDDHFSDFYQSGSGILRAFRTDGESTGAVEISRANRDISRSWSGDLWSNERFTEYVVKSMAAFLAQYSCVQTDRLHVAILAAFLKKDVEMMPNSYFKNEAVYTHSLRTRFPNVRFIRDPAQLSK